MDEIREIPLSEIEWPNPIRAEISDKDIETMSKSIMATGQIQAIVVQSVGPHKYEGVVGHLRFLGAQRAHVTTIMARIHSFSDGSEKKVWQLVENVVRRELNAMVRAEAMDSIKQHYEREIGPKEEIVDSIRKEVTELSGEKAPSRRTVWRYLDLAKSVPNDVKKILRGATSDVFGITHAEQLLRLKEDHDGMLKVAQFIVESKPTAAGLKTFVNDYLKIKESATDQVKEAVEKKEISMKQGAALSAARVETQEPLLELTKKGSLNPAETKKVVDFALGHENRVGELLAVGKEDPGKAVAIAEGKGTLQTEDIPSFFRTKDIEEYKVPCKCPECLSEFKKRITVDWKKGELKF